MNVCLERRAVNFSELVKDKEEKEVRENTEDAYNIIDSGKDEKFSCVVHIGKGKDRPNVGQPDRTETVGPTKWARSVSVQFRSGPVNYSVLDRIIF